MPEARVLPADFDGQVLVPGDAGYDEARAVWNGTVDRRPRYVVRCAGVEDVRRAVRVARELGLTLGIRCGGHSAAGWAVPDDGLMIDLSGMREVMVDPAARTAQVQGGALLGSLDAATQPFGLATTAGIVSHTGIGGLALGGGVGWLARQAGLTCDNMIGFEVVTADGELVQASADENPDLFWGLRGGGGNFGVVTRFHLRLHDVGTQALVAEVDLDPEHALDPLRTWLARAWDAPRQATLYAQVMAGGALTLGFVWVGAPAGSDALLAELDRLGAPLARRVEPRSYLQLQSQSDVPTAHGFRRYAKSHYVRGLPDAGLEAFLAHVDAGVGAASLVSYGGAIADVDPDATAFVHRDAEFEYDAGARWEDPADDARHVESCRRLASGLEPWSTGVYVNALADEGVAGVRRAYGDGAYTRLRQVKAAWDPENVFRLNQNIPPA
ncbi:FAD-binding oxidoreductase [Cellulomonas fimi]|uniref:FAD linked oxidase domain protein n=1 Tax=Cellulomonas fimi (strain ATCC 484 / DSM 20113 / JCM 1341 / CCUG 24087 / LMG 16345 / NBRC 15513 / NCIMB 8980 / NCTC 7547 / NRS-133) TaxID=590998 RepID=F4H4H1_CELFA|nr:FAD-binding oxidoreductase [Cellulomonas fimi]AEE47766.1 FAD linked oxidase domain protein [Cellulomonas fimi ATCC 484]NNH06696.1 FAD-binding oxidoreductase [Cellulomonas fimi]VEH36960.1 6-hydroxy-D-nicotine oxidase [Cellulomonas fimi]